MAIEEIKIIDKIEIVKNGTIQVRETTQILRDGQQIAQTYHRWSFPPGSDVSEMPENVQLIAQVLWTEKVVNEYLSQNATAIA